ncbi:hypothetical protein H6G81_34445 [Scytonema hofmannii FACHB-248]|uniref:Uncharacterized protein n=1 Tax=Scytonema hofmannii FACHB-248 TaxID=1842502 RepID=A0ABR8H2I2_9CYAN|nr:MULTISPECIES: hypothetical protein [Nostocales]MBD2609456.1 hypothetical protein [Scytonema hofmannii FACHB-248]
MKIDINNALTIILGLIAVIGAIYRLAQIEAQINARITNVQSVLLDAIDSLKDNLAERLYINEKKLEVHLTEYTEKKLFSEYRHNATDKQLEHKFNRLRGLIKQLAGFLNKESGFILRDDEY